MANYQFEQDPQFHVWDIGSYDDKATNLSKFEQSWYKKHLTRRDAVMDIGCGPGYTVKMFLDNGIKVLGVDLNDSLINKALSEMLPVQKMDALEAVKDFGSEYSFFHMSDFVEHVPLQVVVSILTEIKKLKNVRVFIATPNLDSLMGFKFWFHMPTHVNPMHPFVIRALFDKLGFTIVQEWSEYGNLPGRGWKLRLRKYFLEKLLGTQASLFTGGANICFIAKT